MAELIDKVLAHFLKNGCGAGVPCEVWEAEYWEIPRKDKMVAHLKVAGSEKPCECPNKEDIYRELERRTR